MTSQETAAEPKLHAAEPKLRTKSRPTFQTEGRGDRCQLQTKSFLKRPSLSFRKTGQATHNFPGAQGPTQVCNNYLHLQVSSNKLQISSGRARNEETKTENFSRPLAATFLLQEGPAFGSASQFRRLREQGDYQFRASEKKTRINSASIRLPPDSLRTPKRPSLRKPRAAQKA
jgi:hypothetical protein